MKKHKKIASRVNKILEKKREPITRTLLVMVGKPGENDFYCEQIKLEHRRFTHIRHNHLIIDGYINPLKLEIRELP